MFHECDILIPAFLEKSVRMSNVEKINCKVILEAATAATSYDAD